jgi:hypothetical protein
MEVLMWRRRHLVFAAVMTAGSLSLAVACGSSPGIPGSPTAPVSANLAGRILRVLDGTPIAGASITVGGHATISSAAGGYAIDEPIEFNEPISVFALGYLKRVVPFLDLSQALDIELIPDDLPFQLNFYRQWVRNAHDSPGSLEPLQRWTRAPSFYIQTTVEDTGEAVLPEIVDRVAAVLRSSVPELSGGRFVAAAIETGPESRLGRVRWVNVTFYRNGGPFSSGSRGLATVGGNTGIIHLRYDEATTRPLLDDDPNGCGYDIVRVAEHEITHTMGFRHTFNEPEDFHSVPGSGCTGAPRSEKARYHAAVAYSRPIGNADVDVDPPSLFGVAAQSGARRVGPIVYCSLEPSRR